MSEQYTSITRLIDARVGSERYGCKRGKWYQNVQNGLIPPPIKLGPRFARWPEHEVEAILKARVAGADDNEIRRLVLALVAARREGRSGA